MATQPTMTRAGRRERMLYGRRRGRPLRPGRRRLLAELLPRLAVPLPAAGEALDPATLFAPPPEDVWLEVGFGGGEHLAAQARARPEIGVIGCEPYVNGVARLLSLVDRDGLDNVRILADDARPLIEALAEASIGRVFLLFPDPWPKARHHKRRFVVRAMLDSLARIMKDGAELRLATDDGDYLCWMLERALAHPDLEWLARRPDDWRRRPADWPPTRYEAKALGQGRRCTYLRFARRARF